MTTVTSRRKVFLPHASASPCTRRTCACGCLCEALLIPSPVFCLSPLILISYRSPVAFSRAVRRENIRTPEDLAGAATQDAVSCANRSSTITGDGSNETSDTPQARGASARFERKASACQGTTSHSVSSAVAGAPPSLELPDVVQALMRQLAAKESEMQRSCLSRTARSHRRLRSRRRGRRSWRTQRSS